MPFDPLRAHPLGALPVSWTPSWIVKGLWQRDGLNLLFGAPRARKSTLAAYLAACALADKPAFGTIPVTGVERVAVFLGEGILAAEGSRFHGLLNAVAGSSTPFGSRLVLFGPDAGFRLDLAAPVEPTVSYLKREKFDLVLLDPLINFHNANENEAGAMAAVMAKLQRLTEAATVVVVHHISKPVADAPERTLSHQARGSSAIAGYTSSNMLLSRKGQSNIHFLATEAKYSPDYSSLKLTFDPTTQLWSAAEAEDLKKEELVERSILGFCSASTTPSSANTIAKHVGGRRAITLALVKKLASEGRIVVSDLPLVPTPAEPPGTSADGTNATPSPTTP